MVAIRVIIVMALLLVILISLVDCCVRWRRGKEAYGDGDGGDNDGGIPRVIWTYWDADEVPRVVQLCIESWKRHNPSHKVVVLGPHNLAESVPELDLEGYSYAKTPQRIADFIRLHVIKKHGGVWVDASFLMNSSIEFVHQEGAKGADLVGFYIDGFTSHCDYPVIENWFFAAKKECPFVAKWLEQFEKTNEHDDYVAYALANGVNLQKIADPNYLTMHVAAQYVMQKLMTPEDIKRQLRLFRAEDGPLKFLTDNDWDAARAINAVCGDNGNDYALVKLRSHERKELEGRIDDCGNIGVSAGAS